MLGSYTITKAQNFTVQHDYSLADSLIHTINPDAKLLTIESDPTFYGGASLAWHYRYEYWNGQYSTYYFLHTSLKAALYDSSNNLTWVGITLITLPWIDSDSAWVIAEAQGGNNFRLTHSNIIILASLQEGLVPHTKPSWNIIYRSLNNPNDYLSILIDATDSSKITGINTMGTTNLKSFTLYQNYPDPFNPSTRIEYTIPGNSYVKLQVFSVAGQLIKTLVSNNQEAGHYSVQFSGNNLSSGVYIYRLSVNNKNVIKKMLYLK